MMRKKAALFLTLDHEILDNAMERAIFEVQWLALFPSPLFTLEVQTLTRGDKNDEKLEIAVHRYRRTNREE